MSREAYSIHLYGAMICTSDTPLLDRFDEDGWDDVVEVGNSIQDEQYGSLPDGFPADAKGVSFFYGPDDVIYIGFPLALPFEQPKMTQAETDRKIRALVGYLFGDRVAENVVLSKQSYTWIE